MFIILKLFIRDFFKNFIEIIFPEFCVGCGRPNTLLCNKCYETLEFVQFEINVPSVNYSLKEQSKNLNSITCCCYYNKIARNLVHQFKYNGVINIGKVIAHIMYYSSNFPTTDLITFVPIHKKKLKKRSFNQTEIIALELGKLTNIPVAKLLIKTKNTKSQMGSGKISNRQKNIFGSIKINPKIKKIDKTTGVESIKKYKSVLIIDDVFTSGTTLNYCTNILKSFGFKNIHGSCFLYRN